MWRNIIVQGIGSLALDKFPPALMHVSDDLDGLVCSGRCLGLEVVDRLAVRGLVVLEPVDDQRGGAGGEAVQICQRVDLTGASVCSAQGDQFMIRLAFIYQC